MSKGYTSNGKRLSSMTHATRGHDCYVCGRTVFGNGGKAAHGRGHVRRGEAVELVKNYGLPIGTDRVFLAPDNPQIEWFTTHGFTKETA